MYNNLLLQYENHKNINILAFTDRKNCTGDFLAQIEKTAKNKPNAIVLREKDLEEKEYFKLAQAIIPICKAYNVPIIIHNFYQAALELGIDKIHMPLSKLKEISQTDIKKFSVIGASTHSLEDVIDAKEHNATYVTAGHIFETNCKSGLKGRGLDFLQNIVENSNIPVYGIGGIHLDNVEKVLQTGCFGVCVMSETNLL